MNPSNASTATRLKVGIFSAVGLVLIGATTVYVNDKPYWWRPCQLVKISVPDATGLKTKSQVRSLGLEIGYLQSVELSETHVTLGICITAPVELLPQTKAFIQGEGFLGDKYVELKPVKYVGKEHGPDSSFLSPDVRSRVIDWLIPSVYAADPVPSPFTSPTPTPTITAESQTTQTNSKGTRVVQLGEQSQDVQHLVNRVDELVNQATSLTKDLKQAINPDELRQTMRQLNRTLENASRTLSPEGGLNQTAQRTLAKLEDAVEQLRDMMTRINKGEGSVGMLINDPTYAEEIREAIRNINKLLSKVGKFRFVVNVGAEEVPAYSGGRGYFQLSIWPSPDRYYLLGVTIDPRGGITETSTTTTVAGQQPVTVNTVSVVKTQILITGMLGKIFFNRLDLAIGALYGDGAVTIAGLLGPTGHEELFQIRDDIYSHSSQTGIDDRINFIFKFYKAAYLSAGLDSVQIQPTGGLAWMAGGGVMFDDEDIKLLFTLR